MSGFSRMDGGANGFDVAHFAHQNDIGILGAAKLAAPRKKKVYPLQSRADSRILFLSRCKNSIGSSMVIMCSAFVELMRSIIAASVVDLPEPVTPVTRIKPRGMSQTFRSGRGDLAPRWSRPAWRSGSRPPGFV